MPLFRLRPFAVSRAVLGLLALGLLFTIWFHFSGTDTSPTRQKNLIDTIDWDNLDDVRQSAPVSQRVHAFYYTWYNSPINNPGGYWIHWNHVVMSKGFRRNFDFILSPKHQPPDDVGAAFYPSGGPYASGSKEVIRSHMRMAKFAGIGVLSVSWYPAGMSDPNGEPTDNLIPTLLDMAHEYGLKICLHVEPYRFRSVKTMVTNLQFALHKRYTTHPAYYRLPPSHTTLSLSANGPKDLPVFFVYDSYTIEPEDWAQMLTRNGAHSIRGQPYDAHMVALLRQEDNCGLFARIGFDAGYTYFVGHGTTKASTPSYWQKIGQACRQVKLKFYPSVGPGYNDQPIRPHNTFNTIDRNGGKHYAKSFDLAMKSGADAIGITSFNEWGEGTQIEPAVPHERPNSSPSAALPYSNYLPYTADFYLRLTRILVNKFEPANADKLPSPFESKNPNELERFKQLLNEM